MKVRELIAELSRLHQELEVICYTEDSDLVRPGHVFTLLDIEGVSEIEGEKVRGDNGTPSLKIGKSHLSQRMIVLEVTSDF